jgi:hypothetical protein
MRAAPRRTASRRRIALLVLLAVLAGCARTDAEWRADLAGAADPYRRTLAAAALAEPDELQPAFRALLAAQEDPVRNVRAQAIQGMAELAPRALPDWLASDEPLSLSDAARGGLADAVQRAGPEAWSALAEALRGERDPERVLALAPLARQPPAREPALRRLLGVAGGEDEALAERALDALRDLRAGPELLPAVLSRLDATSGAARPAALALVLRMLAAELERLEPSERAARVAGLGGADALALLCVEGLASSRGGTPLRALVATWALLGCEAPLGPARGGEPTAMARALGALRLARAGPEAEPAHVALLADEAPEVRAAALLALARAPRGAEARAAIEASVRDPVPVVRRAAHHAGAVLAPGGS